MKPTASLFAKILAWFFLNMVLVTAALMVFFIFQQRINLQALFGRQGADRLQTTGMLIAHDLSQSPQIDWPDILARHASVHQVDFTILLVNGQIFSSTNEKIPARVIQKIRGVLRRRPPQDRSRLRRMKDNPQHMPGHRLPENSESLGRSDIIEKKFSIHAPEFDKKPYFRIQTRHPTRYWSGLRIPILHGHAKPPEPVILLAVSDSFTGKGFFFDPLPWIVVAGVVVLVSALMWIPMVRHITHPLSRMTLATE